MGLVCPGDTVDHADETTISRESFEQNPNGAQTLDNRSRKAKRGGAVLFTSATTERQEKNPSQKPFRKFSQDLLEPQVRSSMTIGMRTNRIIGSMPERKPQRQPVNPSPAGRPTEEMKSLVARKRENGAQGQNRTADTGIFNPLLYRLSYLGIRSDTPEVARKRRY